MKMELKYLKNYLGTGLKGKYKLSDVINLSNNQKDEIRDIKLIGDNVNFFLLHAKPLLLPLSALTEQMEDGSVPIYKLLNADKGDFEWKFVKGKLPFQDRFEIWTYPESFYEEGDIPSQLIESIHINSILSQPYHRIEKLFEWHFDVFKLIDAGLAIDKRTIK